MQAVVNNVIRFAALLSAISMIAILIGWQSFDVTNISINLIMLAVWASKEHEIYSKKKAISREKGPALCLKI